MHSLTGFFFLLTPPHIFTISLPFISHIMLASVDRVARSILEVKSSVGGAYNQVYFSLTTFLKTSKLFHFFFILFSLFYLTFSPSPSLSSLSSSPSPFTSTTTIKGNHTHETIRSTVYNNTTRSSYDYFLILLYENGGCYENTFFVTYSFIFFFASLC
jgi:hypothetical protein